MAIDDGATHATGTSQGFGTEYLLYSIFVLVTQAIMKVLMHDRLMTSEDEKYDAAHFDKKLEDQAIKQSGKKKRKKRKSREYTICKKIMKLRKKRKKIVLMTNVLCQPETLIDFQIDKIYLTHNKIPLSIPTWSEMPNIIPPCPELVVSEGESIKLDQPLTSNIVLDVL